MATVKRNISIPGIKKGKSSKQKHGLLARAWLWFYHSAIALPTVVLCALLLCSALSEFVSPQIWVIPSFLGIAYSWLLAIAVLWTFVVIVLRRWHCLLLLLATLVLTCVPSWRICPLHLSNPSPITTTDDGDIITRLDTLNVFTYNTCLMGQSRNLHDAKRKIPLLETVRESGADFVCLQEYGISRRKKGHSQEMLRQEMCDIYPYHDLLFNTGSGNIGIAVFSRYPIIQSVRLDQQPKGYVSAMYYRIKMRGRQVGIVNLHLQSNKLAAEDRLLYDEMVGHFDADSLGRIRTGLMRSLANAWRKRAVQVDMIAERLEELHPDSLPLLVCGDFNDTPVSYTSHTLRGLGLTDTWQDVGFGPGISYHEHRFWFRIDQMLHSRHFHTLRAKVRRDVTHSDHYPVQTTYQILPE